MSGLESLFSIPGLSGGSVSMAAAAVLLIVGLVFAFFGYRIWRVLIGIGGFFVGALLGALVGALVGGMVGAVIGAILLGVLGAVLAVLLYQVGVFFAMLGIGILVGVLLFRHPVAGVILGIVLGILGVVLARTVIILATGVVGGVLAGSSLSLMANGSPAVQIIAVAAIAVAGIVFQFWLDRRKPKAAPAKTAPAPTPVQAPAAPPSVPAPTEKAKSDQS